MHIFVLVTCQDNYHHMHCWAYSYSYDIPWESCGMAKLLKCLSSSYEMRLLHALFILLFE